jgi:hypothetical protein
MEQAAVVLVVGGMFNLFYGYLTGFFFAAARQKSEFAPRYLVMAHVGPYMQGAMLLGLVFAVRLSQLSDGTETAAAAALVVSSFCIAGKDTINWLQGVSDEIREKPPLQVLLGTVGVITGVVGFGILFYGVIGALV